jgi:kynurenine 3-monooxygenase
VTEPRRGENVSIVGAGLAGSFLAILLARRGARVTLYEKRPDPRRTAAAGGRSINLALANRGIHALERAGLMERLRPMLIPMRGRMLHDEQGRLQLVPYGHRPHEVIYSVSRGGLNGMLAEAAEAAGRVEIRFGESCVGVDFDRHRLRIEAGPGQVAREATFEVVIGTDGSASAMRTAILEETRGELVEDPLGHGYKELSIPPAPGGGFRMEKNALHIWPRGEYMLIALPNADESFTATLFLPNRGEESFEALHTPEDVRSLFSRRFPDAIPLIPALVEDFFGNPTGHLETIHCRPWHFGDQALIVGDAAHAIVPFHGQGMNAAFEDCDALDESFADASKPWGDIFSEFGAARRPNTEAIAAMALENYVEMRKTVREPLFQLKKQVAFALEERHPRRFIPRYSQVMFHRIPYAEARRLGAIQADILSELTTTATRLEDVDFALADRLIAERLPEDVLGGEA